MSLQFKAADKTDCRHIAELIAIAGEGIPEYFWSLAAQRNETPLDYGAQRIARDDSNFSYRNAIIAQADHQIMGMVLAYSLRPKEKKIPLGEFPELVHPFLRLERQAPDSYYINALAVYPQFRRRGLAWQLLETATENAGLRGHSQLSIIVFEQNSAALRLYLRYGFAVCARQAVAPHYCYDYDGDLLLLTKIVPS